LTNGVGAGGCGGQLGSRGFQRLGAARHDHHVDALAHQRFGAAVAQSLARAAHQRGLACNAQIHVVAPDLQGR
jgi:hypothetical protein